MWRGSSYYDLCWSLQIIWLQIPFLYFSLPESYCGNKKFTAAKASLDSWLYSSQRWSTLRQIELTAWLIPGTWLPYPGCWANSQNWRPLGPRLICSQLSTTTITERKGRQVLPSPPENVKKWQHSVGKVIPLRSDVFSFVINLTGSFPGGQCLRIRYSWHRFDP